jgi:hypothetical protein
MQDFESALGQYTMYRTLLQITAPERRLYLAIPEDVYLRLTRWRIFLRIQQVSALALIVVDIEREEVSNWID